METIIKLDKLGLSFEREGSRTEVLHNFDLDVKRGEFVAIIGPSGVGKSTLLRVVAGLLSPTAGKVQVNAVEKKGSLPVAMVFQDARLLPWRKVIDNVGFGLERSVARAERIERARKALELVQLAGYEDRFPHELSGGQRQRVALARALAVEPEVLLMDEPFAALDAITRETLQDELARVRAKTGKTILFVTHSINEAVYLADRVVAIVGTPGGFGGEVNIETKSPRSRSDPELAQAAEKLRDDLSVTVPAI